MKDVAYLTGEAWQQVKAEFTSKVWCKTMLNRLDRVNAAEASIGSISNEEQEPEPEADAALISAELRHASFFSIKETDIQEWLNVNSSEPGDTALSEEEIIQVMSRLDKEDKEGDDEVTADKPAVPSHSEVYASFSTFILWSEAQAN